jgi:hypothetical protein
MASSVLLLRPKGADYTISKFGLRLGLLASWSVGHTANANELVLAPAQ